MRNGWVKYFGNGHIYSGPDNGPLTSWSKTQLDNIVKVHLQHYVQDIEYWIQIEGSSQYHQADTYEARVLDNRNQPELIARRISYQITDNDSYLVYDRIGPRVVIATFHNQYHGPKRKIPVVHLRRQWFQLIIDLRKQKILHKYSPTG